MAATTLVERYAPNLHGVLSCYDLVILTGTLPGACDAGGMTSFLYAHGIRILDHPRFAEPLRDRIRERAQQVCQAAGIRIEHVNKSHLRKEDLVARVSAARGDAPGLVCSRPWRPAILVPLYDALSRVLRVETTVNDVSFFKHHRRVEHKGAYATRELAPLKKSIYSLIDLREILLGCNQRYLAFLSSLDDPSAGQRDLRRLSQPRVGTDRSVEDLNFFNATDRPAWRAATHAFGDVAPAQATAPAYLTRLGRAAIATPCSLARFNVVHAVH